MASSFASSTMNRGSTVAVGHDAQAQASRTAAVGHRLAHVDHFDAADRPVARDMALDPVPDRRSLARLARHDQSRLTVGRGHQLRVEQIRTDCIGERHLGGGHFDIIEAGTSFSQAAMSELRSANACSCANSTRSFATATTSLWNAPAAIASSDCSAKITRSGSSRCSRAIALRRLDMLARGESAAGHAVNEHLDAGLAVRGGQPHVIGRALVAERGRHRRREPRSCRRRTRGAAAPASLAIHGCGAASSAGWRRSGGICRPRCRAPARRSLHWPPTSPKPTSRRRPAPAPPPRSSCQAPPANRGWAADAARRFPAPARAPDWRASCRCPAAQRRAGTRRAPAFRAEARLPKLSPA